jgi:Rrf2 family protein
MHLLAQEEYGLRCLVQLARHRDSTPLTIPEIAAAEGLSPEYTAKLMRALRQGGLVMSTRGAAGGYRLARRAEEVTAWEVLEELGGSLFPEGFCDSHPGSLRDCVHSTACSIRSLWRSVEGAVRGVLEHVTVAELARAGQATAVWVSPPGEAETDPARTTET